MRLGTLTGSEAFYKPLALKDAVKRARLSKTRGRKLALVFAEGLEAVAGAGPGFWGAGPKRVLPLAVRFQSHSVRDTLRAP